MFARLAAAREPKGPAEASRTAVLRRTPGEREMREWSRSRAKVQAKLAVGPVDDPLEAEADGVAEQVLRAPEIAGNKDAAGQKNPRHARGVLSGSAADEVLPLGGQPLDMETRAFFEPRFGYDFSRVRIYPDEKAAESAQSMGALAYTAGPKIAFGASRYQPATGEGRRLLAHELTHVVQQGHATAVAGSGGVRVSAGRATPSIQRDTPSGAQQGNTPSGTQQIPANATAQGGPLSVTKRYEDLVSREEVKQALITYLYDVQREQGGQTLHMTDTVKWAVRMLFQGDATLSAKGEGVFSGMGTGSVPEFADKVAKLLPEYIPRANLKQLGGQPTKETPDTRPKSAGEAAGQGVVDSTVAPLVKKMGLPKDLEKKIIEGARDAVGAGLVSILDQAMGGSQLSPGQQSAIHSLVDGLIKQKAGAAPDKQQEGAGSPYGPAPVEPPGTSPSMGSVTAPGEHTFNLPKIPWDFPTKKLPKPILPEAPAASAAPSVDKIIQGLDDASLLPAAAKGKPDTGNYAGAKEFARSVADQLAAADKDKKSRGGNVDVMISADYRHVEDLRDVFDKMAEIIKKVAA
ncbi:MAG TPA: DUF4157 domain-containing protein, partial [Acidobacteriaceae bacterium]